MILTSLNVDGVLKLIFVISICEWIGRRVDEWMDRQMEVK